jgi:hypothetical protein
VFASIWGLTLRIDAEEDDTEEVDAGEHIEGGCGQRLQGHPGEHTVFPWTGSPLPESRRCTVQRLQATRVEQEGNHGLLARLAVYQYLNSLMQE